MISSKYACLFQFWCALKEDCFSKVKVGSDIQWRATWLIDWKIVIVNVQSEEE